MISLELEFVMKGPKPPVRLTDLHKAPVRVKQYPIYKYLLTEVPD